LRLRMPLKDFEPFGAGMPGMKRVYSVI
jgi:hypothetical protein